MTSMQSDTATLGAGGDALAARRQRSAILTGSGAGDLAELWGDTINTRHLGLSLLIGVPASLAAFLLATVLFDGTVDNPQIARAYAMLAGIVACLATGSISARLFRPKRTITEEASDPVWREAVLAELQAERGGIGPFAELSPATVRELEALGLREFFEKDGEAARSRGHA